MLSVINKNGGNLYFQIFYGTIVMLSLMFLVALPVLSQIINPGAKCEKRVINYHGIYGKCWTGLVSVKTPLNAYDITGITSNCLIILLSVLSVIAAYKRKKIIIYGFGCLIILAALMLMVYTGIMISLYAENSDTPNSSDISREVHNQLIDSLYAYRDGDPAVKKAWENIMRMGCCCGVDGYRDFLELGEEIPEYCTCRADTSYRPYSWTPFVYKCNFPHYLYYKCDMDPNYNVTSKGCMGFVLDQVQEDQNHILIVKMITFMSVSTLQLILIFFAMMFTSCSLHVPTSSDCGGSARGSKFVPLPEAVDSKDNTSIDAI